MKARWREMLQPSGLLPAGEAPVRLAAAAAAAMAFVACIILALALAAGGMADRWEAALGARTTVELPPDTDETRIDAVITLLLARDGVTEARRLTEAETRALLEPWLGEADGLREFRLPILIDVGLADAPPADLARALEDVQPGAVLVDHAAWWRPVEAMARAVRRTAWIAALLVGGAAAATLWLAAAASAARNARAIEVLRLVGAEDGFIVSRLARPFALASGAGALLGSLAALAVLVLLRLSAGGSGFVPGPSGGGWLAFLLIPPLGFGIGWAAARAAVARTLARVT